MYLVKPQETHLVYYESVGPPYCIVDVGLRVGFGLGLPLWFLAGCRFQEVSRCSGAAAWEGR
jgi:hypothetical protein